MIYLSHLTPAAICAMARQCGERQFMPEKLGNYDSSFVIGGLLLAKKRGDM